MYHKKYVFTNTYASYLQVIFALPVFLLLLIIFLNEHSSDLILFSICNGVTE